MKIALLDNADAIITAIGFVESADGKKIIANHYGKDLITSLASFYMTENLEGSDDITVKIDYYNTTGVLKVTIGDTEYTAIAGISESFKGVRVLLEGADSVVELVEGRLENLFEEVNDEEVKVDPTPENYDGEFTEQIVNWECTNSDHTGSPEQSVTNLYFPSGASAVFTTGSGYANTHGAVARLLADEFTGNKYLNIVAPKRLSDRDRAHGLHLNAQKCVLDPNVFIVETDIKLDSVLPDGTATHTTYLQITLTNDNIGKYVMFIMTANPAKVTLAGVELADWDTWFKLKIEYYPAEGKIQLYADGAYKGEISEGYQASSASDKSFATLGGELTKVSFAGANSTGAGFSMNFDNSMLYGTTGTYVGGREPEVNYPDGPNYETFDRVKEAEGLGNSIIGKTGTSVSYSAKTNDGGAKVFLRTDESIANNFITIYSAGRATSTDRSHGISVPIVTLSADTNMLGLEATLFLNSNSTSKDYIQISFSHKPDANHFYYGQFNMSIKDGVASFGGVEVGRVDEWFDLKFEFYLDVGKMKVYNGEIFLGEITTFSQASTEAKLVSELAEVSSVAINTYNGGGAFLLNVDNVAAYTIAKEYVEETAGTLPEANPTPDDFDPTGGSGDGEDEEEGGNTGSEGGTTDPIVPDTPVDDEDIVTPGDNVEIPGINLPDDGSTDEGNFDEWTQ